ncbi:LPS export ABC transporter periplasmic protein LptC [Leptolyngbya sp. AN02str]|uniref:LPS export ABC transporter periplasmic protein LptC n=1 Tax=Leptolyngbya sp. AN02str TaxID=3423363 RepID=UPI003D323733
MHQFHILQHKFSKMAVLPAVVLTVVLGLSACGSGDRTAEADANSGNAVQQIENDLTFSNITLEQADDSGAMLWKVTAREATYNEDQQVANVASPSGELFDAGQPIYRVKAQRGVVQQDGEKILLKGKVEAVDLKSKAVLTGDELEWIPKDGVLIVRNNLKGEHAQVRATANEARLYNKDRRMELIGQVNAVTKDPALIFQGERLVWRIDDERIVSDRPVQITRVINDRVSDVALSQKATVELKTKVATLQDSAQVVTSDPPMQVNSPVLIWNLEQETINSNQPLTIVLRQQMIVLSSNRGNLNMRSRMAFLNGNVQAVAQRDRSLLRSNALTWNMATRDIVAEGNVDYRQADPPLMVKGPRAVGRLENQTVVMSGGRVVTEIIPR